MWDQRCFNHGFTRRIRDIIKIETRENYEEDDRSMVPSLDNQKMTGNVMLERMQHLKKESKKKIEVTENKREDIMLRLVYRT